MTEKSEDTKELLPTIPNPFKNSQEYVGEAGGGMVRVVLSSNLYIKSIEIDKTAFANSVPEILDDLNFISDLVKAAANQAIERSSEDILNKFSLPKFV